MLIRNVFAYVKKGASGGATVTREDKVKQVLDEIIEKLPEEFNMLEIMNKVEERTPYVLQLQYNFCIISVCVLTEIRFLFVFFLYL